MAIIGDPIEMTSPSRAISSALYSLGYHRQGAQARIIGEAPQMWSRYLNEHTSWGRAPQSSKVQTWLTKAAANGVHLSLTWTGAGCTAEGSTVDGQTTA